MFAPKKYLSPKEATDMERTEMYSLSQWRNPPLTVRADKLPHVMGSGIWPRTENCVNLEKYLYSKEATGMERTRMNSLSRWRHYTCAGRETTPSQGERYRGENGNLHKLG